MYTEFTCSGTHVAQCIVKMTCQSTFNNFIFLFRFQRNCDFRLKQFVIIVISFKTKIKFKKCMGLAALPYRFYRNFVLFLI